LYIIIALEPKALDSPTPYFAVFSYCLLNLVGGWVKCPRKVLLWGLTGNEKITKIIFLYQDKYVTYLVLVDVEPWMVEDVVHLDQLK
jgi:hypothetical protein